LLIKIAAANAKSREYVYVSSQATVSDLRRQVADVLRRPAAHCHLSFFKRLLDDRLPLSAYHIMCSTTVEVLLRELRPNGTLVCFRRGGQVLKLAPADPGVMIEGVLKFIARDCDLNPDHLVLLDEHTRRVLTPNRTASDFASGQHLAIAITADTDPYVLIQRDDDDLHVFDVREYDCARDLKRRIRDAIGVAVGRQRLSEGDGEELPDPAGVEDGRLGLTVTDGDGTVLQTQFGVLPVWSADATIDDVKWELRRRAPGLDFELFTGAAAVEDFDRPLAELGFGEREVIVVVPRAEEMVPVKIALEGGALDVQLPAVAAVGDVRAMVKALAARAGQRLFCNGRLLTNDAARLVDACEGDTQFVLYWVP
jgi:hypothetical protein